MGKKKGKKNNAAVTVICPVCGRAVAQGKLAQHVHKKHGGNWPAPPGAVRDFEEE